VWERIDSVTWFVLDVYVCVDICIELCGAMDMSLYLFKYFLLLVVGNF